MTSDLRAAVETLRRGGLILYPTDTVWGIGCDATNSEAVRRIFRLKNRADSKALITLVADLGMLERTATGIPDVAYELMDCSDRPLTIVYDGARGVAPELTGPDGTIGIRLPRHQFCQRLCRMLGRPIVSTSANVSGAPTPATFGAISPQILNGVDYVCLTGRDAAPGRASTVMRLSHNGVFTVIRP